MSDEYSTTSIILTKNDHLKVNILYRQVLSDVETNMTFFLSKCGGAVNATGKLPKKF
jgi:hypothetical protein